MKYVEEKSPSGYSFRLFPESGQMIIFDRRGKTVNLSGEPFGEMIRIPFICFAGRNVLLKTELYRDYSVLKVRDGRLVVPYVDRFSLKTLYFFMPVEFKLDIIPARMILIRDASEMMKSLKEDTVIDRMIFDQSVSENDEDLIVHRYRIHEVFRIRDEHKPFASSQTVPLTGGNPVFLACQYIRKADMISLKSVLETAVLAITDIECINAAFKSFYNILPPEQISGRESIENMTGCLNFCCAVSKRDMQLLTGCTEENMSVDFHSFCMNIIRKERSVLPLADRAGREFLEAAEAAVMKIFTEQNTGK